eukprot:Platyproteum_vivax@DN1923_c0_g1_i1.p1
MSSLNDRNVPCKNLHFVFVYGTLKRGYRNHYNMRQDGIQYLCDVETAEPVPLYLDEMNRNRPCLVDMPGVGECVKGELYGVTSDMLHKLDIFERVPTHYHRRLTPVLSLPEKTHCILAYVYFNVTSPAREVAIRSGYNPLLANFTFVHNLQYVPRNQVTDQQAVTQQYRPRAKTFFAF